LKKLIIDDKSVIIPTKRKFLSRAAINYLDVPQNILERINSTYKLGYSLVNPCIFYTTLGSKEAIIIPEKLKNYSRFTYFCTTIGDKIDAKIAYLFANNYNAEGFLLDAWGSESVEALNCWFDNLLRKKNGKGSLRFSPGYKGLSILENYSIIKEYLEQKRIVSSKKTGILTPSKSCVCIIGWDK